MRIMRGPRPVRTRPPGPNELRDHLANERTFLAWIRTTITIVALGFVVAKFGILLREVGGSHIHPQTARFGAVVGVLLVLFGLATAGLATMRFLRTRDDIERDIVAFDPALDVALAAMVGVVSIVLAGYLIVTS
jgi:putative membrane protein